MKVAFVILCYGKHELVMECVDTLMKLQAVESAEIVLVDNNSPDGTGVILKEKYANDTNIHVLQSDENVGFARGNNLGYRYAKEELLCDTQVIMNDDVFIYDTDFLTKLQNIISEEPDAAILAPDVLGKQDRHSNPLYSGIVSNKHARRNIAMNRISNLLLSLHINYKSAKKVLNTNEVQIKQYGIMPHGCCVIYTQSWVDNENQAFYPGTFLFCEEYFLTAYALAKGYKTEYNPALVVKHLGDASIDANTANTKKKKIFINRCQTKSLKLYLEFIKNAKGNWNI